MKNLRSYAFVFSAAMLFASCADETTPVPETEEATEVCDYNYNPDASTMEWTAFKFTEKAPVKGTFTEINMEGNLTSDNELALLSSLRFSIPVSSISTQNEDRDAKIVKHFFGTLATEKLTGKVVSVDENGEIVIEVTMNKMTKPITGKYTLVDGKFNFTASIDVADWNAIPGITALNTICKDLHTSKDGKSKLWSEVDLMFSTTLDKVCD